MEIGNAYELIVSKVQMWIELFIEMLPNLAVALLVIIAFYAVSKGVRNVVRKVLDQVTDNKTIINLLDSIVGTSIIGIGIFIALGILNLDDTVTTLLAGAGIIGLALGFAFQDIASNFISGVILSIRHPFGVGDIISSNGHFGTVQKLNLRNTIIKTPQGQLIYIPNKSVFENPLENYTSTGQRRVDLSCGVSYGDDLEKAKSIALEAITEVDAVDTSKAPEFYYDEFGDSSVNFKLRFWINFQSNKQFWKARSESIIKLKSAFDDADIMIPFPIRTLDFGIRGGEGLDTVWTNQASHGNGTNG